VMPDPMEPIRQEPGLADGEQARGSADTGQVGHIKVPEQGKGPVPEQTLARGDRPSRTGGSPAAAGRPRPV
jgi:hypothetical protein